MVSKKKRIYYFYEDEIEKSTPQDQHLSSLVRRVMTNGDPEGQIFPSHPHTHDRFL